MSRRKLRPFGAASWDQKKKRFKNKRRDERYFCGAGCGHRVPKRGAFCASCLLLIQPIAEGVKDDRYERRQKREMYRAMVPLVAAVFIQSGRFEGINSVTQALKIVKLADEVIDADPTLKLPDEDV